MTYTDIELELRQYARKRAKAFRLSSEHEYLRMLIIRDIQRQAYRDDMPDELSRYFTTTKRLPVERDG